MKTFELRVGAEVVAEMHDSGHIHIHRQLDAGEFFRLVQALGGVGEKLAEESDEPLTVGFMVQIP